MTDNPNETNEPEQMPPLLCTSDIGDWAIKALHLMKEHVNFLKKCMKIFSGELHSFDLLVFSYAIAQKI